MPLARRYPRLPRFALALWLAVGLPGDAERIRTAIGSRSVSDELARMLEALR